jgi:phosphatidylglycerophosphatase A
LNRLARVIATWFYSGYAPKAPGTAGSLAAIVIAWFLPIPPWGFAILAALVSIPGIWAADVTARELGVEDPQIVVVDEVAGQWLTLAGATHLSPMTFLVAFVLFRLFDMTKPPPVRQLENLPGGYGIVADDLMAGVYGALVLFVVGRVYPL